MLLIDLAHLPIDDTAVPAVQKSYEVLFPNDHIAVTQDDAYRWLKQLSTVRTYTKFQVVCTESAFPFWGHAPEEVEVISFAGKKMPKSFRTDDVRTWIAKYKAGARTKTQVAKVLANDLDTIMTYEAAWSDIKPIGVDLNQTNDDYKLVTKETFDDVITELTAAVEGGADLGWDTETENAGEDDTSAPNPFTADLVGLSISVADRSGYYFPVGHKSDGGAYVPGNLDRDRVLEACTDLLFREGTGARITHNGKYDFSVLASPNQGVPVDDVYSLVRSTEDTMLLAAVVNEERASLKYLAETYLDATVIDFKKLTAGKSFAYVPLDAATVYAAQDADWTRRLYPILLAKAEELDVVHIYREIELPLIEYFMRMERNGFAIDIEKFQERSQEFVKSLERLEKLFRATSAAQGIKLTEEFNINSGQQVAKVLFDPKPYGLGLPVRMRTQDNTPATNKKHFNKLIAEGINPPLMQLLRRYRDQFKLYTSYIEPLLGYVQEDGRVRTSFHQLGAATGRTSATDPALQTLPGSIRDAFVPEHGGELSALDYSQIELRVMATRSGEEGMLSAFRNWEDIHARTQQAVGLSSRTLAKNFNFGVGYGAAPPTLSETAGIPLAEAEAFYDAYWEAYPTLRYYLWESCIPSTKARGYAETWTGRKRLVTEPKNDFERMNLDRLAMNTPIQGGALDIIKIAMRRITPLLPEMEKVGIFPVNMVHDELDFERRASCPPDVFRAFMSKIRHIMETTNPWPDVVPMPVDVEYGKNWAECK